MSPFEFIPDHLNDANITATPSGSNLVYTVNDNSTLNTGFVLIDANGCVHFSSFTSSSGSASPSVITGTNPCCNISTCFSTPIVVQQAYVLLTAKGGSGNYIFTLAPSIQAISTIKNNLVVITNPGTFFQSYYTVTDANNPSCNITSLEGTGGFGTGNCCIFQLCYSVSTSGGNNVITVNPSNISNGGTGPYTFISQFNGTYPGATNVDSGTGSVITYAPGQNVIFTVNAADVNGCTSEVTFMVNGSTITTSPTTAICN